jgi:hypothetical protein
MSWATLWAIFSQTHRVTLLACESQTCSVADLAAVKAFAKLTTYDYL